MNYCFFLVTNSVSHIQNFCSRTIFRLSSYLRILKYGEASSTAILDIMQHEKANITRPQLNLDNSIILVSDLRPQLLVAAFKIARGSRNVRIIASNSIIRADYGDNVNFFLRLLLLAALRISRRASIVPNSHSVKLDDSDLLPVLSSLVSITCNANASQSTHPLLFNRFYEIALGCKSIAVDHLSSSPFSNIIVFNGRTAGSYFLAKTARNNLLPLYFTEFGRGFNGFRFFDESPHSPGNTAREVIRIYEKLMQINPFLIQSILRNSEAYINEKLSNVFALDYNKDSCQFFDVIIFAGSDYEYIHTDPSITGLNWSSNLELAKFAFDLYPDLRHCLRLHPNSINSDQDLHSHSEAIMRLAREQCIDLTVIHDPSISSYDLIKNTLHVVVQYSTIAIDSIFLGVNPVFQTKECDSSLMLDYAMNFIPGNDFTVAQKLAALCQLQEFAYLVPFNYLERSFARMVFLSNLLLNKILPAGK